mgnify:CR=1 FL=1
MENIYIPHLSVDCVLFRFHKSKMQVMLVHREKVDGENPTIHSGILKLPGRLIYEDEFLEDAASSIVREIIGNQPIHLQQFQVFGNPNRIQYPNDLVWLQTQTNLPIKRVVTIAFYALITTEEELLSPILKIHKAQWINVENAKKLAFDHDEIVREAYAHLKKELTISPLEFKLLPDYFTLNSLQELYEVILNQKFDNRNFRKKIRKLPYLERSNKKEEYVTHRPAKLYRFNPHKYEENQRELRLFFL